MRPELGLAGGGAQDGEADAGQRHRARAGREERAADLVRRPGRRQGRRRRRLAWMAAISATVMARRGEVGPKAGRGRRPPDERRGGRGGAGGVPSRPAAMRAMATATGWSGGRRPGGPADHGQAAGAGGKIRGVDRLGGAAGGLHGELPAPGGDGGERGRGAEGGGVQRAHPDGGDAARHGEAARGGDRDAHAGEVAGADADADGVGRVPAEAGAGEHLGDHGHQALGLAAGHGLVAVGEDRGPPQAERPRSARPRCRRRGSGAWRIVKGRSASGGFGFKPRRRGPRRPRGCSGAGGSRCPS